MRTELPIKGERLSLCTRIGTPLKSYRTRAIETAYIGSTLQAGFSSGLFWVRRMGASTTELARHQACFAKSIFRRSEDSGDERKHSE